MVWEAHHISQSINRTPADLAEYAGNPANLPLWASGLSDGIRQVNGVWVTDSLLGDVQVEFVGDITAGILDHEVTLPDGVKVHNPLRVLINGAGSEVVFTLYRLPEVSSEEFETDKEMIIADLEKLKAILELP